MGWREKPMSSGLGRAVLSAAAGWLLLWHAGNGAAQPVFQTGADVEVTEDGLHPLDRSIMGVAWVRPDADLSDYTSVFAMPAGVQFRDVPDRWYTRRTMETAEAFHVSEERKTRLREMFRESFSEAITDVRAYELADGPGRDVLLVQAFLTDVISGVPPDLPGSAITNIKWAWEANIVLELRDAMSDTVLARTVERQRMDGPFDAAIVAALTPTIVDGWSRLLVRRLTALRDLYPSRLQRLDERNRE